MGGGQQQKLGRGWRARGTSPTWTLSSMQPRVTFKKALSFADELTAHLWIFSFAILPSSRGHVGRWDGKCTNGNGQGSCQHQVGAAEVPSGNHTEGFSKSLVQPLRVRASGLCLFLFSLLSKPSWPHFLGCTCAYRHTTHLSKNT